MHRVIAILVSMLLLESACTMVQDIPAASSGVSHQASPTVSRLVKSTKSWDGTPLPAYPKARPEVTILRITIPAGSRLPTHIHPVINAGVLISGELTVVANDGRTLQLKAGDPIVEVVKTSHYGINKGKVPAEVIVFYAGAVGTPITVVTPLGSPNTFATIRRGTTLKGKRQNAALEPWER